MLEKGDPFIARMRYWISKCSGDWLIYDFEDLDLNLRTTYVVASMIRDSNPATLRNSTVGSPP